MRAEQIRARDVLQEGSKDPLNRSQLIALGESMEEETAGGWLAAAVVKKLGNQSPDAIVVDAARTVAQCRCLGELEVRLVHVHLTAAGEVRKRRFEAQVTLMEDLSFEEASAHPIESNVEDLAELADLCLDSTGRSTSELLTDVLEGPESLD